MEHLDPDTERLLVATHLCALGQLAGAYVHELNTPLAALCLRTESLARTRARPDADPDRIARNLAALEQDVDRLREILGRYGALSSRFWVTEPASDLGAECARAVELVRHQAQRRRVKLEHVASGENLPPAAVRGNHLGSCLVALLLGGCETSAGPLALSCRRAGVDLEVELSGVSIPAGEGPDALLAGPQMALAAARALARAAGGDATSDPEARVIRLRFPAVA